MRRVIVRKKFRVMNMSPTNRLAKYDKGRPPLGELSLPFDAYDDIETYLCPNNHECTRDMWTWGYKVQESGKVTKYKRCKVCISISGKKKYQRKMEKRANNKR